MISGCCDRLRRDAVARHPTLNGIDYLEVIDSELAAGDPARQRTLLVTCLKPVPPLGRDNVVIGGGERIPDPGIDWAAPAAPLPAALAGEPAVQAIVAALPSPANVLVVRTSQAGDFSQYTLRLRASATDESGPPSFDPRLLEVDFSFKVECPTDFDCQPATVCPPEAPPPTDVDYLAKDYGSFRRLLLDRLSQSVPDWGETSVADQSVALAELLAYVGDHLSYQQDAVSTEAYLGTARRRVSLRRHAVLVDYPMHDGCTARAWLHVSVDPEQVGPQGWKLPRAGTQFLTRCTGSGPALAAGSPALLAAMLQIPTVFEPLADATLFAEHDDIDFYTWGDGRCCLPRGTTRATLADHLPNLHVGDTLLFEEVVGPVTGQPEDADPRHRHVVRLTSVNAFAPAPPASPPVPLTDPLNGAPITEIAWAPADALPFALCLSTTADAEHGGAALPTVSKARGNLVLADHGQTIGGESLGSVPAPRLFALPGAGDDRCAPAPRTPVPARYRPSLAQGPLSQAGTVVVSSTVSGQTQLTNVPFDPTAPAVEAMSWSMEDVLPQLSLTSALPGQAPVTWSAKRTLLSSGPDANEFVAEIEDDGSATLRFGDNEHGRRPDTDTAFTASYRVGNGAAGNVGAETIQHVVVDAAHVPFVLGVRNPLPAAGGVDPEAADSVRRNAPQAFRVQERAVTPADYAAVAQRLPGVQRAAATLRWTGSWYTVFITVDPQAGADRDAIGAALPDLIDGARMAGHDFELNDPSYVSLEIGLDVCVQTDSFRSAVRAQLLDALGSGTRADGRPGLFHPDNFTFGQPVFLSAVYAAAHAVPGVDSVQVTTFQRQGDADPTFLAKSEITLGALEIARLDNDRNFPERGVLTINLHGGK